MFHVDWQRWRKRGREPYKNGKNTPWQPGDEEAGDWPREALVAMLPAIL